MTSPEAAPDGRFLYVVTAFAAVGGFLFGYDTGVINGALTFIKQEFDLPDLDLEVIVTAVLVGALFGAAAAGRLADRFGRRVLLMWAGGLYVLGALASAFAPGIEFLIGARVVVGIAIGITSTVAPLYIAEVAPAARRGALVSLFQLAVTVGILVSTLVDEAFEPIEGWRWMLGLAVVPGLLLYLGMLRLPDTPRWLLSQGRADDARAVLQRVDPTAQTEELAAIEDALTQERAGTWSDLLAPAVKAALFVGVTMAIFQQITGINAVIYYDVEIFKDAGFTSDSGALLAALVVASVNVAATFIAIRYLDGVGRRPLLIVGLIGMTTALTFLGLTFQVLETESGGVAGGVAIALLCTYIACFAFSLGPVVWVLLSEIYPTHVRGLAISVATTANWGSNVIVGLTFLTLTDDLGPAGTFWIFAGIALVALLFTWRRVPETRERTLEEIESFWRRGGGDMNEVIGTLDDAATEGQAGGGAR